jgi:two-component system, OmpR family, osmolarity sensor histidine kinase EnvZ
MGRASLIWPRSLLARNAALIVALVLGSQIITLLGHLLIVQVPRANQLAELTGRYITVLEQALASTDPPERDRIITGASSGPLRIVRGGPPPQAASNWLSRVFVARMHGLLPGRAVIITPAPDEALWLEARAGGERLWVVTEAKGIVASNFYTWLIMSLAGVAIGLAGALLINRRINRPLAELEQAARQVGAGGAVPHLPESGPAELAAVAAAFNRMVRDLEVMDKDRALMLAGISHDLRTPLTRARLAVEMLGETADTDLTARIVDSIDKVDRTLGQFLAFARDEAAEPPAYTDINQLLAEIVESEGRVGAMIGFEPGELPEIAVRPLALSRAVENLAENALKHGKAPFSLATVFQGESISIIMRDHGVGIASDDTERLIQPFQQLRPDKGRSAGLGLAIADRIARLHGGDLTFRRAADGAFEAHFRVSASAEQ